MIVVLDKKVVERELGLSWGDSAFATASGAVVGDLAQNRA